MSDRCSEEIISLYERHASSYDRDRSRSLVERAWLERFLGYIRPGGRILDLGCGMGEPIARYLVERGFDVAGVDASPSLLARCRERLPSCEWILQDMRELDLGRRFDGVLAWDSFFHLAPGDQHAMFPRFASHAAEGAPLLFTSGPIAGEAIGSYQGERLYHASCAPKEYERLLAHSGFTVRMFVPEDPDCGGHTVWLATFDAASVP